MSMLEENIVQRNIRSGVSGLMGRIVITQYECWSSIQASFPATA